MSSYKKDTHQDGDTDQSLKEKLSLKGKCSKCNKPISLHTRYNSGKINKQPYKMCKKCHKESSPHLKSDSSNVAANSKSSEASSVASFIGSIESGSNLSFVTAIEVSPKTSAMGDPDVIDCDPGSRANISSSPLVDEDLLLVDNSEII